MTTFRVARFAAQLFQPLAATSGRFTCAAIPPAPRFVAGLTNSSSRQFHTSLRGLALADSLQQEVADQEEHYKADRHADLDTIPAGFTLEDVPGNPLVKLKQMFGKEEVSVEFSVTEQNDADEFMDEEDDEEERPQPPFGFEVVCTKGNQVLRFSCTHSDDEVEASPYIEHVAITPKGTSALDESKMYTGPVYSELDDQLKADLLQYIKDRGVDANMAAWLVQLNYDKEQREYMRWLKSFQSYVEAK